MRFVRIVQEVLLRPTRFFRKVQKERHIAREVAYLALLVCFSTLFLTYIYIREINTSLHIMRLHTGMSGLVQIPLTPLHYVIACVALAVLLFSVAFLRYWIVHLPARMLGARKSYRQTLKALVYSRTPEYIGAPLFLAFVLTWGAYGNVDQAETLLFIAAICIGTGLAGISVYQMILRTRALSLIQAISLPRAFLSIYVLGTAGYLTVATTIMLLLLIPALMLLL